MPAPNPVLSCFWTASSARGARFGFLGHFSRRSIGRLGRSAPVVSTVGSAMAFARQPLVELVALAALLGVVWRGEVEWHGWDGLRWVGYFHWAVPVGGIAFLAWLASTPVVRAVGRRWGLLGIALPHAVLSIWLTHECLFGMFNRFAVGAPFFLFLLIRGRRELSV